MTAPASTTALPTAEQPLLPPRPEQGRALLVVLSIMALLAALALLFASGSARMADRWETQLSNRSTVQILIADESLREAQLDSARSILADAVPDAELTPLSAGDARALLRPWLGDVTLPADLPVPGLIEIDTPTRLPVEALDRAFTQAGIRARIDDHSRFSSRLRTTVARLVALGASLVLLIGLAATAVSIFATRAALSAQRDIIHVLVQAGASDRFVAKLFLGRAARRGALAGLIGGAAGAIAWIFISGGPARGTVGWPGLGAAAWDILLLLGFTIGLALICAAAAGWAATRQLRQERRRA